MVGCGNRVTLRKIRGGAWEGHKRNMGGTWARAGQTEHCCCPDKLHLKVRGGGERVCLTKYKRPHPPPQQKYRESFYRLSLVSRSAKGSFWRWVETVLAGEDGLFGSVSSSSVPDGGSPAFIARRNRVVGAVRFRQVRLAAKTTCAHPLAVGIQDGYSCRSESADLVRLLQFSREDSL